MPTYYENDGTSSTDNRLISGISNADLGSLGSALFGTLNSPAALSDLTEDFDRRLLGIIDGSVNFLDDSKKKYSKENAITDAQDVVANIFRDYRNTDLPKIYSAQNTSGGYNSTTAQLLANDAFGAATAKSADAVLKNIVDYRKLNQGDLSSFADLFKAKAGRPDGRNNAAANAASQETDFFDTAIKVGLGLFGF